MSKNKIEISNKEEYYERTEENDIINHVLKEKFFEKLDKNGFNNQQIKNFLQEKRISSVEQNRFNFVLRKIKKESEINISDMILFLENNIHRLKKLISVLDEETRSILKQELASKYKIKIDINILHEMLV